MFDCPKFRICSAPICPLDPGIPKCGSAIDGSATGGVKEPRCRLRKSQRMELGADLPWRGLWPRELAAMLAWERLSDDERAARIALNKKYLGL